VASLTKKGSLWLSLADEGRESTRNPDRSTDKASLPTALKGHKKDTSIKKPSFQKGRRPIEFLHG